MKNYPVPLKYIKGVGEKRELLLKKLGITSLYELVHFYPRTYLDFSSLTDIVSIVPDTVCAFSAVVGYDPIEHKIRKGMTLYKTIATDGIAGVHITIFNSKYLADSLKQGQEYIFYGKVTAQNGSLEMANPIVEAAESDCGMRPVYPLTAGLTSKILSKIMANALTVYFEQNIPAPVPDSVRTRYNLAHEQFALRTVHSPKNAGDLAVAKRSLIFEELLTLQTGMRRLKSHSRGKASLKIQDDFSGEFISSLPFTLTKAQERVISECIRDMQSDRPMNRLVQGDVGSGKTVVAAALIFTAAKNGMQSALMAPTEILARQHYETLTKLTEGSGIGIELLTGSVTAKNKREIKERLKSGASQLVVGTHALLTDDTEFQRLGLIVTDEQHRFGVNQRGTLSSKGSNPHTLVMSATPIPRTLSLIIYGDLDISIIDELPKGRQKISTYAVDTSYRKRIYAFIKKHLDTGLQAYIVCPAVEESENGVASAVQYAEELSKKEFADYKVGLLHGKMKGKDKEAVMSDFASGEIQLLVSTTVIEVGVDVPNAAVMVIENAESFGLSQLHQLRGRVGRGTAKSYCVLISDNMSEGVKSRLDIMCRTNDGFAIADKDLELRGPGDFFGERQHGLPELKIASLTENMDIVRETAEASEAILKDDPMLKKEENLGLRLAVRRLFYDKNKHISLN